MTSKPHSGYAVVKGNIVRGDMIVGVNEASILLNRLEEQLEASQRHHEAAVVKIHLVEGRADQLRYALRDAMAFVQPEVAGDYPLWEALVGDSFPAIRHTSDCGDRSGDCTCGATRSDGSPWPDSVPASRPNS